MSVCLMPITVRCLPPDVQIQEINTGVIKLVKELSVKIISVHNAIFIFDLSKMFKIMNIHFKFKTSDISQLTLCIQ